ncbi:MAG: radical SAM protein, partial [Candidatus Dadabacteria bacterium]
MSSFSVTLLLTEKCNLRCDYCYERYEYKGSDERQADMIKKFFGVLSHKYDSVNVSFFGGEPMLEFRRMKEIMAHNSELNCAFSYSLTSNGTMLALTKLQELLDGNLVQFQITLDGWKDSHDKARLTKSGDGTFDLIYENLLSYRKATGNFTGVIRVNASQTNADD